MNILVTGSNGRLGRELISTLEVELHPNDGKQIICVDLHHTRKLNNPNIVYLDCDIANTQAMLEIVNKYKPETVVHLAAIKIGSELDMDRINNIATCNLYDMLDHYCTRFIYANTAAKYIYPNNDPTLNANVLPTVGEAHRLLKPYGLSKYLPQLHISDRLPYHPTRYVISFNIFQLAYYSPTRGLRSTTDNSALDLMDKAYLDNRDFCCYTYKGELFRRSYITVVDAANYINAAIRKDAIYRPGLYDIDLSTTAPLTMLDIYDHFISKIDRIPDSFRPKYIDLTLEQLQDRRMVPNLIAQDNALQHLYGVKPLNRQLKY